MKYSMILDFLTLEDTQRLIKDNGEGENLNGKLDIAVGRIISRTIDEARIMVDKIIGEHHAVIRQITKKQKFYQFSTPHLN